MAAVIFLATTSFLALFPDSGKSLSLLLCYFTFMFLYADRVSDTMGADYDFSTGLRAIPNPNFEYHENLPGAYLFLTMLGGRLACSCECAPRACSDSILVKSLDLQSAVPGSACRGSHPFRNQVLLVAAWQESAVGRPVLGFFLFDHAAMVVIGLLLLKFLNGKTGIFRSGS